MRHWAVSIVMTAVMGLAALGATAGGTPSASGRIAFVSTEQIYLMNADGSHLTRLTNLNRPAFNTDPAFAR